MLLTDCEQGRMSIGPTTKLARLTCYKFLLVVSSNEEVSILMGAFKSWLPITLAALLSALFLFGCADSGGGDIAAPAPTEAESEMTEAADAMPSEDTDAMMMDESGDAMAEGTDGSDAMMEGTEGDDAMEASVEEMSAGDAMETSEEIVDATAAEEAPPQ